MTKSKRYNRRFLPMLWIGLTIWLVSILVLLVLEWTGHSPSGQETLMDWGKVMFKNSPVFTLLLLCVLQPILEEFSFRLWGAGKKWMTIICLILMAVFVVSSVGWWGIAFVAAILIVWIGVADRVWKMWINAVLSSACFALCHLSGFGDSSIGTVLGLTDIFGFALVLSWLAINFSIWLSALLHVLNNSLAILLPLLFLSDPVSLPCCSLQNGEKSVDFVLNMEPLHPFADNDKLIAQASSQNDPDVTMTEFCWVGEPAEIAARIATRQPNVPPYTFFDWSSKGQNMEERVVFNVRNIASGALRYDRLLKDYGKLVEKYTGEPLTFDTSEVMLKTVWIVYPDGREVLLEEGCEDYRTAVVRVLSSPTAHGNILVSEAEAVDDSTTVMREYCLWRPDPLEHEMASTCALLEELDGFKIEYRDSDKKATVIMIK